MTLLVILAVAVAACYRYGDWKNWEIYQSTILFFIVSDMVYKYLTCNYRLWYYSHPLIAEALVNLMVITVVYPATILIFIPKMKKSGSSKVFTIIKWIAVYLVAEVFANNTGLLRYSNGWNIYYSVMFDCLMFPILWLHFNKPLLAYLSGFITGTVIIFYFRVPL